MMYYGNSGATTTSSASDTYFNPVSYYYLDESSGNVGIDSVGIYNLTNVGNVAINQLGKIGKSYRFSGSSSTYLTSSGNSIPQGSNFTINLWVMNATGSGSTARVFASVQTTYENFWTLDTGEFGFGAARTTTNSPTNVGGTFVPNFEIGRAHV